MVKNYFIWENCMLIKIFECKYTLLQKIIGLHVSWMGHVKIVLDRILNINKSSVCYLGNKYKFIIVWCNNQGDVVTSNEIINGLYKKWSFLIQSVDRWSWKSRHLQTAVWVGPGWVDKVGRCLFGVSVKLGFVRRPLRCLPLSSCCVYC